MSNLTSTIRGYYPLNTFEILRALWQQMAETIIKRRCYFDTSAESVATSTIGLVETDDWHKYAEGKDVRLVTNLEMLPIQQISVYDNSGDIVDLIGRLPQFSLLQSDNFQALLTGSIVNLDNSPQVKIEITFTPVAIDRFIQPLIPYLPPAVRLIANANFANNSYLQSHFTQLLLSAVVTNQIGDALPKKMEAISVVEDNPVSKNGLGQDREQIDQSSLSVVEGCQQEINLQQQLSQAVLLNYISNKIHQTLELDVILQTAVEQVQTFLQADRLIIYQFEFTKVDEKVSGKSFDAYNRKGKVAYEAIGPVNLPSVLDVVEHQNCFENRQLWDNYRAGMTRSIDDVNIEYTHNKCILKLMHQSQIKSKLIVPIIVNTELWGLAIAHQCQSPRQWKSQETQFLQQVSEHLAFAINQSELYTASLCNTQNLEQRVNERTRELRDAVIVAQTANQSKTEFLALLSHELRTPLTSILGLSATLLRLPLLNLTDRQQNYLQTIHNSGEHLSELIDDILDFYKLEVGKTLLKISEFPLSKPIDRVVKLVKTKAERAKIKLEVQIVDNSSQGRNRDLRFQGDIKRIRQILLNILVNAIKFTPEDGTVIIRAWLEDNYAVFEIEDSGIGIEEEQIPRLFKKFYQLDRNFARDYEGMGLGLAITQQLVELHGGSIEVDSILGSGSTFTVRLAAQPLQSTDNNDWLEMDRKLVFQDPELNPIPNRIVLIEQDEDLANFLCDILTAARYQVTWLLSAESSFRQIAMFDPDLLIIDLALDAETVDRLIGNIRKSSTIGDIKIMAIATKEDTISPISKQYVDDYLWKQVNPEQLLRKITKLLSHIDT
ncbi:ATP-binding protein [Chamaesiphon sp. VAR_48_metabat_135_sub]|uniref:ATP-binding protein n=1 Tax=Chamaesiphon sp. VAR_48_metabat_135_sub TaxID=2964699 RepID=UPI00286CBE2B|nr:ATP-binding protein [Chamaesiphon sp. VAR_48_metabat_135_sub]